MSVISVKQLLESGVHFGHQTRKWNPKMKKYIFGERNGIYIINLKETSRCFDRAFDFVKTMSSEGRNILFVGTKKQAQDSISEEAVRSGMYFVNQRWLGGMLTNFSTIKARINYLKDLENKKTGGYFQNLNKKEIAGIEKEIVKLTKSLGGIKDMHRLPDAIFIVDPQKEHLAVKEAKKLNIPVIAMVDTNCDPDSVDFVIPSNDDAIKSVKLITGKIADAIIEGKSGAPAAKTEEHKAPEKEVASEAPATTEAESSEG